jgi:hypothetical protein
MRDLSVRHTTSPFAPTAPVRDICLFSLVNPFYGAEARVFPVSASSASSSSSSPLLTEPGGWRALRTAISMWHLQSALDAIGLSGSLH